MIAVWVVMEEEDLEGVECPQSHIVVTDRLGL